MRFPDLPTGLCLLTLAGLSLATPAAGAGDAPDRGQPAPATAQGAEAIQAPAAPLPAAPDLPYGPLQLFTLSPVEPLDRGSDFTDAGFGSAAGAPTALELAKLDMARAAIEASRAAGTLNAVGPQAAAFVSPEDQRAAKMDLLRTHTQPAMPETAGPAGVGGGLEPLQLLGPSEPTAEELAKLEQSYPATPNPAAAPAAPAKPAAAPASGDPQQTPTAEVQR
jgi:hypothetical protein